jgi:hypothetical protein
VIYVGFGQAFHEELGIGLMLMRIGGNACGLWVREGTPAFQIMISDITNLNLHSVTDSRVQASPMYLGS